MDLNTLGRTKPEWSGQAHEAPLWCHWWWQHLLPACCRVPPPCKKLTVSVGGKGEIIYFKQLHSFRFHYILENCNAVRKRKWYAKPFSVCSWRVCYFQLFPNPRFFFFLIKIFHGFSKTENWFQQWERKKEQEKHTNASFICKVHIHK